MRLHRVSGGIAVVTTVLAITYLVLPLAGGASAPRAVNRGAPEPALTRERVTISVQLLESLMAVDLDAHQAYFARVRVRRGEAAAAAAEGAVRAPYLRRIEKIRAAGRDSEEQEIAVITIMGAFRFSAMSFDGGINEKDPVSLLVYGDTSVLDTYDRLVRDAIPGRSYQDENGQMDTSAMRECRSQTQWVLMGNVGEELNWHRSQRGLMRLGEKCTEGLRDHIRFYGDLYHRDYGRWLVGTPHREAWVPGAGHRIDSWTAARDALRDYWLGAAPDRQRFVGNPTVRSWDFDSWGNAGLFQGVPFDGYGLTIGLNSLTAIEDAAAAIDAGSR
ncbi:MAG TPA: hypothetical protein VNN10_13830 [Dehalococcoidia bacterium]|nr:hypothetical protein [Dehalococcoidia bacterium]